MYVKWVVRRHKNEELANITFYDAYLVQSYKNNVGEPRQRTIAYLGNLRQINNVFPVIERALFYMRMEESLNLNLSPEILTEEERSKLYSGLSEVAPPPTEDEVRQGAELHRIWHTSYWRARALNPTDASKGFAQFVMDTYSDEEQEFEQVEPALIRSLIVGKLNSPPQNGKNAKTGTEPGSK